MPGRPVTQSADLRNSCARVTRSRQRRDPAALIGVALSNARADSPKPRSLQRVEPLEFTNLLALFMQAPAPICVLSTIEQIPFCQRVLRSLGIRAARIEDLGPTFDPKLAAEGRYIFVANDNVSRMDQVMKWLERSFGMDTSTAALAMYGIHHHGLGVVGAILA